MSITHYEYAVLCGQSYKKPTLNKENLGYNLPQNWEYYHSIQDNGYFGIAFKKDNNIVVVHRGTNLIAEINDKIDLENHLIDFFDDTLSNIQIWLQREPMQYSAAIDFSYEIITHAPENTNISFSGHSLGGTLAKLTAIYFNKEAVVFDSPGEKEILEQIFPYLNLKRINIIEYATYPNLINTVNSHLKPIHMLPDSLDEVTAPDYINFIKLLPRLHSINEIIKKFDPVSGKALNVVTVAHWPLGVRKAFEAFISYDFNKDFWDNFILKQWYKEENFISFAEFKKYFIENKLSSATNDPLYFFKEIDQIINHQWNPEFSPTLRTIKKIIKGKSIEVGDYDPQKLIGELKKIYSEDLAFEDSKIFRSGVKFLVEKLYDTMVDFVHEQIGEEYDLNDIENNLSNLYSQDYTEYDLS